MNENEFDEIWKPVKSVIEHCKLEYGESVTIGGQFGKLKEIILEMQEKIKYLEERDEKLSKLEAYGVDNWSWYNEAINDVDNIWEDE